MFTLKLYKRDGPNIRTMIRSVTHIHIAEIGNAPNPSHTLNLRAFPAEGFMTGYDDLYIGERTPEMTAITNDNHWEWGLLENCKGNTSQHLRPYTYG